MVKQWLVAWCQSRRGSLVTVTHPMVPFLMGTITSVCRMEHIKVADYQVLGMNREQCHLLPQLSLRLQMFSRQRVHPFLAPRGQTVR